MQQSGMRATFERCRGQHEEIHEKLKSFERLRQSETAANDDVAWHNACETIQLKFGVLWGHCPSRVTEDTCHSLSDDSDAILHADLARSVILENVWLRIGSSSPHLRRQFEVKDSLFESYISQLSGWNTSHIFCIDYEHDTSEKPSSVYGPVDCDVPKRSAIRN